MAGLFVRLTNAVREAAANLDIPCAFEDEVFKVPLGLHIRAAISLDNAVPASLGTNGITRIDGQILLRVIDVQGQSPESMLEAWQNISLAFPRGARFTYDCGEVTIMTSRAACVENVDGRKVLDCNIRFYSMEYQR